MVSPLPGLAWLAWLAGLAPLVPLAGHFGGPPSLRLNEMGVVRHHFIHVYEMTIGRHAAI